MKRRKLIELCFCVILAAGHLCLAGEKSVEARIAGRTFPSVFQAWSGADNLKGEGRLVTAARHDLIFHGAKYFGLKWDHAYHGLAVGFEDKSIAVGLKKRRKLINLNPNVILLMEIRYRDAYRSYLSADHKWWRRDKDGKLVMGWAEGGFIQLDFSNPDFREHVAKRAAAAVKSGVVDGIMLDWWGKGGDDRLALVKTIRNHIGDKAIIIVNANNRKTPKTAPFVNGYFMECTGNMTSTPKKWNRIAETLIWGQQHLRKPRVICLETWYKKSRADLRLMRATTTLSLTLSDGYCLFSDPNPLPTPDHLHNWYKFWDADLGRPLSPGSGQTDGSFRREFSKGTAVYNPMGNKVVSVTFHNARMSAATASVARKHTVASGDGDIFLKVSK